MRRRKPYTSHHLAVRSVLLQCVAQFGSMLQFVAVCCSAWQPNLYSAKNAKCAAKGIDFHKMRVRSMYLASSCSMLQDAAVCCSVPRCVAVCRGVLQCASVYRIVWQFDAPKKCTVGENNLHQMRRRLSGGVGPLTVLFGLGGPEHSLPRRFARFRFHGNCVSCMFVRVRVCVFVYVLLVHIYMYMH